MVSCDVSGDFGEEGFCLAILGLALIDTDHLISYVMRGLLISYE